jgi:hypothetical protein
MVSRLSGQPLSWGQGLQNQGQGFTLARWELIFKTLSKPLKIFIYHFKFSSERAPEIENFFYQMFF